MFDTDPIKQKIRGGLPRHPGRCHRLCSKAAAKHGRHVIQRQSRHGQDHLDAEYVTGGRIDQKTDGVKEKIDLRGALHKSLTGLPQN